MDMNPELIEKEFLQFLAKAHRHTYAAPKEIKQRYRCATPILPGHRDYHFVDGDWAYHDSYSGKLWAPGSEVTFYKDEPFWRMSYQGQTPEGIPEEFAEEAFDKGLKPALMNFPDNMPFRGPPYFRSGDFEYFFKILQGDWKYFLAKEWIVHKRVKEVFFQDVMGSLIK